MNKAAGSLRVYVISPRFVAQWRPIAGGFIGSEKLRFLKTCLKGGSSLAALKLVRCRSPRMSEPHVPIH